MNAIILAGGKNTRMLRQDKAFLEINSRPLVARIINALKDITSGVIVVTNSPAKYSVFGVRTIQDEKPQMGPLMGIYSGLKASKAKHNFVVACDMPFINLSLIKYMMEVMDDYDIVVPKIDGQLHPLFGIYSKKCVPVIKGMLQENILNVRSIFPKLKTYFITRGEVERFDSALLTLANINTKEEYEAYINDMPVLRGRV